MQQKILRLKRKGEKIIFRHKVIARQQQVRWLTTVMQSKLTLSDVQFQQNLPRDKTDTMTGTYLPKNALELTATLRERWGIKADAYLQFIIIMESLFLDAFKNSLTSLRIDE